MSRVRSSTLPAESLLHRRANATDFLDCYVVPSAEPVRAAAEILLSFPSWAQGLLKLRNLLVVPLGLATSGPSGPDQIGPFPIESESDRELIAGFDDTHLDFRIAVLSHNQMIHLATWVRPHHLGGHLYLAGVTPFHIAIVRDALRRLTALEGRSR